MRRSVPIPATSSVSSITVKHLLTNETEDVRKEEEKKIQAQFHAINSESGTKVNHVIIHSINSQNIQITVTVIDGETFFVCVNAAVQTWTIQTVQ